MHTRESVSGFSGFLLTVLTVHEGIGGVEMAMPITVDLVTWIELAHLRMWSTEMDGADCG